MTSRNQGRSDQLAQLIKRADLVMVAGELGLQVDANGKNPRKAICPFHADKTPSLNLYPGGEGRDNRAHYHCFVCGAHGDVITLIQGYERLDFLEAVRRLGEIMGEPFELQRSWSLQRKAGVAELVHVLESASLEERLFDDICTRRQFARQWLHDAGAAVVTLQPTLEAARDDREFEEALILSGIARRREKHVDSAEFWRDGLRGFFGGKRLVFRINDIGGGVAGFAARALNDSKPKYLYSYGFSRSETLYRADRVLSILAAQRRANDTSPVDLYLVEGLFDALRLESLGFHALAVLGSRITAGQLEVLARLVGEAGKAVRELRIHIFFDRDDAGRRGAYDATIAILKLLSKSEPFSLDVVSPKGDYAHKIDPDEALRILEPQSANAYLLGSRVSPITFLAAFWFDFDPHSIDWPCIPRLKLAWTARRIALALGNSSWARIVAPLETAATEHEGLSQLISLVGVYGRPDGTPESEVPSLLTFKKSSDDHAELLSALTLGRSSCLRREYPLDDASWDRLSAAASTFLHIHRARLNIGDGPSAALLARELPKGGGKYRRKSGPVAEDAILHQYLLVELLRDRPECAEFSRHIPAVRYSSERSPETAIYHTGNGHETEPVSFAYQIDMAIVNGEVPPRREGIFRPYFDCWRSFIKYIDERVKAFCSEDLQIMRLDITGFYDNIRRDVVDDALAASLELALAALKVADGDVNSFAPLLLEGKSNTPEARAEDVTKFIIKHTFGLTYLDPLSGEEKLEDPSKGIPQGPDLSSYLANICLFRLDALMAQEVRLINDSVRDGFCGAAYARYVDDIVLVCRDLETASQLRRKIEAHLRTIGLALNRKNATPPPMSRVEAQAWITDNRAGFGFSGPLADLPTTDSMDPLAEAGEIDRKTALGLMFDVELDNPRNIVRSLDQIALAMQAPDLRFNDRASAYRRLWIFAAMSPVNSTAEQLAESFLQLFHKIEPLPLKSRGLESSRDSALACIEGLERALRFKVPAGSLRADVCKEIEGCVDRLASAILEDVFQPLVAGLMHEHGAAAILERYDIRTQIGVLACLAARQCRNSSGDNAVLRSLRRYIDDRGRPPLNGGLLWSMHLFDKTVLGMRPSLVIVRENAATVAFARLHGAIVNLQRLSLYGENAEELLPPTLGEVADPNDLVHKAVLTLRLWAKQAEPNEDSSPPDQVELDAASTLINFTYNRFSEVAATRPRLAAIIAGQSGAMALPSPPGLRTAGILLWCRDGRLLLASPVNESSEPVGVTWQRCDTAFAGISLKQANISVGCRPLFADATEWSAPEIANIYRAFFPRWSELHRGANGDVPIPTVFSFFARKSDSGVLHEHTLVMWSAPSESVDGHAFVRSGNSLEPKSLFVDGAEFWRYGWSIRDLCDRLNIPLDAEDGLDSYAATPLSRDSHRREAIVTHVLSRLSGNDRFGPGNPREDGGIPVRIERGLGLLEHFGSGTVGTDAAYVVAAVSEGVCMSERIAESGNVGVPGFPAALLVRSARRSMRALPEASLYWRSTSKLVVPYRRSAAAWFSVAQKLFDQVSGVEDAAKASLQTLSMGAELLGVDADLRALAFELAGALDPSAIDALSQSRFDEGWLEENVGLDVLLVISTDESGSGISQQLRLLVSDFCQIVVGRRAGLNRVRDRITSAGWTVLVAILLQVLTTVEKDSGRPRPTLWPMNSSRLDIADAALAKLLLFTAAASDSEDDSDNWPWEAFSGLQRQRPEDLALLLKRITDAAMITVETAQTTVNPRSRELLADKEVIRLNNGLTVGLSEWQVDIAFIKGERGTATEAINQGDRILYCYSLSRSGEQVIGLHLVSRKLAAVAFGARHDSPATSSDISDQSATGLQESANVVPDQQKNLNKLAEPASHRHAALETEQAVGGADDLSAKSSDDFSALLSIQRASWRVRASEKTPAIQRVALVQWDVTDTYHAPEAIGDESLEGLLIQNRGQGPSLISTAEGGSFVSTTEHRRRAILRSVLNACVDFGVDGLILPEYSVRPETINWLARQLKHVATPITIWCGTFRIPGGTSLDFDMSRKGEPFLRAAIEPTPTGRSRYEGHSALLTYLRNEKMADGRYAITSGVRRKRYPSAAAGEQIRPPINEEWRPLLDTATSPFDIGTYAIELICSEMFPHASSANFIGLTEENESLANLYGLGSSAATPFEYLTDDVYSFAKWTSHRNRSKVNGDVHNHLYRGTRMQRTLIVLPAMTSRAVDYHIFGQNQYLAAGLVTAFCNAYESPNGCGKSCFIGLDGWRDADPPNSPYAGVAPGIFQLGGQHTGPLGAKEAAIVIADLDLMHSADQKPRPHYQARPLQLVAHLPLIFETEQGAGVEHGDYPNRQRRARRRSVSYDSVPIGFEVAASSIHKALERDRALRVMAGALDPTRGPVEAVNADIETVNSALAMLELFADDPAWLRKRREAVLHNRYQRPSPSPLPALLDWVYVDDRWTAADRTSGDAVADVDPLTSDEARLTVPRTGKSLS